MLSRQTVALGEPVRGRRGQEGGGGSGLEGVGKGIVVVEFEAMEGVLFVPVPHGRGHHGYPDVVRRLDPTGVGAVAVGQDEDVELGDAVGKIVLAPGDPLDEPQPGIVDSPGYPRRLDELRTASGAQIELKLRFRRQNVEKTGHQKGIHVGPQRPHGHPVALGSRATRPPMAQPVDRDDVRMWQHLSRHPPTLGDLRGGPVGEGKHGLGPRHQDAQGLQVGALLQEVGISQVVNGEDQRHTGSPQGCAPLFELGGSAVFETEVQVNDVDVSPGLDQPIRIENRGGPPLACSGSRHRRVR